ncbi:MAG: lipoprotein [Pseudomonadota bacterium]|nr:lipoprotein [Pseudomonadota bacterium]
MRFLVISLVILLSACGQRGALYLPDQASPQNHGSF